jgi:hypothetical protein
MVLVVGRPHPDHGDGLTWRHDILKEVVDGEQILTSASRRRHAPVTPVSSRCERKRWVDTGDIDD